MKNCDKNKEGYSTIEKALQTMTNIARHINEMKRKHEDAVHIQVGRPINDLFTTRTTLRDKHTIKLFYAVFGACCCLILENDGNRYLSSSLGSRQDIS